AIELATLLAGDGMRYIGIEGLEFCAIGVHGRLPLRKMCQPLTVGCPGERHSRPRFPMVPHLKLASHAARQSWRKPLLPASRHNEVGCDSTRCGVSFVGGDLGGRS